jgi:hypothetical protein
VLKDTAGKGRPGTLMQHNHTLHTPVSDHRPDNCLPYGRIDPHLFSVGNIPFGSILPVHQQSLGIFLKEMSNVSILGIDPVLCMGSRHA